MTQGGKELTRHVPKFGIGDTVRTYGHSARIVGGPFRSQRYVNKYALQYLSGLRRGDIGLWQEDNLSLIAKVIPTTRVAEPAITMTSSSALAVTAHLKRRLPPRNIFGHHFIYTEGEYDVYEKPDKYPAIIGDDGLASSSHVQTFVHIYVRAQWE